MVRGAIHPEVTHTRQGQRIIERFLTEICHLQALWTTKTIIENNLQSIRQQVGEDKVLLACPGGRSSVVMAALLHTKQ